MKIHRTIFLFWTLVFCVPCVVWANPYIDSLQHAIKQGEGQHRFDAYFRLADSYRMNDQFDLSVKTSITYKDEAQTAGNVLETVKAYALLSNIYTNLEDYETALLFQDSAVNVAGNSDDHLVKSYVNYSKLVFYYGLGDDEKLSQLSQETLLLLEPGRTDKFLEGKCNYYLYVVHSFLENPEESKFYALKTIDNAKDANEMNLLASGYAALGVSYKYEYKINGQEAFLDSTMYYTKLAGDTYFLYPGKVTAHTLYMGRLNEASYLLQFYYPDQPEIAGRIVDSVQNILDFMEQHDDFGKAQIVSNCYGIMASLASDQGNNVESLSYLEKALSIVNNSGSGHFYYVKNNIFIALADTYTAMGDYQKASEIKDSLFVNNGKLYDENRSKMVSQLEAQYQSERKERELLVLKDQAKSHKRIQYLYFCLALIGVGGMFFMFRAYHFRLKYSLEHQQKLEAEKHEADSRILLQEGEQARLKAEQQLLELQQQKLRDEVMVSQLQVQHKNEVLQQLKAKLNGDAAVNIQQIIRDENLLDGDFENAKFRIQEVHPNFFKTLNELARTKLTVLDQKYCAYIYLAMDTKQIVQLLNVEPKSVRMAKYRLKQKFGVEKDMDLHTFLQHIG